VVVLAYTRLSVVIVLDVGSDREAKFFKAMLKKEVKFNKGGRQNKPWKVTTFFFSHFPNSYGERDMLKIFQRWGSVEEVFISTKLNRWGNRFGFVRFSNVKTS